MNKQQITQEEFDKKVVVEPYLSYKLTKTPYGADVSDVKWTPKIQFQEATKEENCNYCGKDLSEGTSKTCCPIDWTKDNYNLNPFTPEEQANLRKLKKVIDKKHLQVKKESTLKELQKYICEVKVPEELESIVRNLVKAMEARQEKPEGEE